MKKTLALLLALVMVLALCACGSKEETPAAEAAAPAAEAAAPAAEAAAPAEPAVAGVEGEASGEGTGEPQSFELFDASGYDKTFDGYKQYLIDAINATGGPADILAGDIANIEAMTEDTYADTTISMYLEFGLVVTWPEFQG